VAKSGLTKNDASKRLELPVSDVGLISVLLKIANLQYVWELGEQGYVVIGEFNFCMAS
jgi:hypothetical protein